ncbi:MAG TPA: hypothetical protein VN541_06695 [Tepidisphaeraceae bacterium]|nr:hypothetical protein [Tepidisphaeraceae bacterium]
MKILKKLVACVASLSAILLVIADGCSYDISWYVRTPTGLLLVISPWVLVIALHVGDGVRSHLRNRRERCRGFPMDFLAKQDSDDKKA